MKLSELITNSDGRLSTTGFIQFFTFIGLFAIAFYCVYLNRPYVPELFLYLVIYGGGGVATKGFANAFSKRNKEEGEQ
ncbi:DUF2644 domain-containing protein [Pasteurella multocida]|uniref:DUF2644 domain-containing protein n=1 Tax=Pasteurella multocida TaxID=747 RepID=UPI00292E516B|nr:DUF2644 domain-containing protein [Pasteurella multocida]WNY75957.1 DUF2644 domain-containing protein [Pasteurella multocida]